MESGYKLGTQGMHQTENRRDKGEARGRGMLELKAEEEIGN